MFHDHLDTVIAKMQIDNNHVKLINHLIALALVRKTSEERQVHVARKLVDAMAIEHLSGVDDLSQEHLALEVCSLSYLKSVVDAWACFRILMI